MDSKIKRNKMKTSNIKYKIALIALFLIQLPAFADGGFEEDVDDATVAPIDDWIYPAILLTIVGIYFLMRKKQTT
jgi:hypothetical protein